MVSTLWIISTFDILIPFFYHFHLSFRLLCICKSIEFLLLGVCGSFGCGPIHSLSSSMSKKKKKTTTGSTTYSTIQMLQREREREKKIDSASAASDTAERIDSSRVTHGSISTGEYIIETSDWEINKKLSTKKKETDEEKKKYSHLIKRKKKCICLNCNRHRLS